MKSWLYPGAFERWKDVHGYGGLYLVSTRGRVFSVRSGKAIKGGIIPNGYKTVSLYREKKPNTFLVHRLVAAAFIKNPDGKPFVNHIDGCKTNNHVDNLEWCTPKENTQHGVKMGTITGVPRKLAEHVREEIRNLHKAGDIGCRRLAREYGVHKATVQRILREAADA